MLFFEKKKEKKSKGCFIVSRFRFLFYSKLDLTIYQFLFFRMKLNINQLKERSHFNFKLFTIIQQISALNLSQ